MNIIYVPNHIRFDLLWATASWHVGGFLESKATRMSQKVTNGFHRPFVMFQTVSKAMKIYITGWWFGTFFYFFIYWECHHPNWRTHIFQRGRLNHQPDYIYIYILDPMNWFVTSSSTQKFSPSELCVNSLEISWWGSQPGASFGTDSGNHEPCFGWYGGIPYHYILWYWYKYVYNI